MGGQIARRYIVRGRVQGVGFRSFVQYSAGRIGTRGWVRNLNDGTVEVYAVGTNEQMLELESCLWRGPRWSDVRGVHSAEDVVDTELRSFRVR